MRPGQFIQCGIRGFEREEGLKNLSKLLPTSVALFRADYTDDEDLRNLIAQINIIYRKENGVKEPYIAVDQEGGNVVRLPWLNYSPSNYFLGRLNNLSFTEYTGMLTGYDLHSRGIRWNLAPVLDVLNSYNPVLLERSFGEDIDLIAEHGAAYIRGLQRYGVCATAKHFPGHGGVLEDSHLTLPRDSRSHDMVMNDAYPFRKAIEAGVKSIMLSHVLYESVDPDFPASLSGKMHNLLRNEFGYGGLVVTDSVDMKAVKDNFSPQEIVKQTLGNEADLLEVADMHMAIEMSEFVLSVDSDKLKKKLGHIDTFLVEPASNFRPPEYIMDSYSLTSSRIIRKKRLDPSKPVNIFFLDTKTDSKVSEAFSSSGYVIDALEELGLNLITGAFDDFDSFIGKGEQIILIGRNEHMKNRHNFISAKSAENDLVYISTSISKDTGVVPCEAGYIAAYSGKGQSILGAIYRCLGLQ